MCEKKRPMWRSLYCVHIYSLELWKHIDQNPNSHYLMDVLHLNYTDVQIPTQFHII
jgi:hypothetical protein